MLKVGITGGIGSGKSIVSKIFQVLEVPTYNSDNQAKMLMQKDEVLKQSIRSLFGKEAYLPNGELNTGHISKVVFEDKNTLEKLNAVVHPVVRRHFEEWARKQQSPYIIKEAALLVETGSFKELDKLIVVIAPEQLKIRRILSRDPHRSENQIKSIMNNQMRDDLKKKYADFLINNDENHPILPLVLQIHNELLQKV